MCCGLYSHAVYVRRFLFPPGMRQRLILDSPPARFWREFSGRSSRMGPRRKCRTGQGSGSRTCCARWWWFSQSSSRWCVFVQCGREFAIDRADGPCAKSISPSFRGWQSCLCTLFFVWVHGVLGPMKSVIDLNNRRLRCFANRTDWAKPGNVVTRVFFESSVPDSRRPCLNRT